MRTDPPGSTEATVRDETPEVDSPHTALPRAAWWTAIVVVLTLAAALAGLSLEGAYTGAASTAEMLRGFDLVAAAVVAPALAVAAWFARHGSARAQLVSAGLAGYLVYTYAYYLFGTGFNGLFLLHAAALATALVAPPLQLASLDKVVLAQRAHAGPRLRGTAVVLGVLAVALGGMWVYFGIDNALSGDVPSGSLLVETGTVVHLGMALDLAVLVPLYGAAFLLRRRPASPRPGQPIRVPPS